MWVSCWDNYSNRNVFVLSPEKINERYEDDMEYTDFAKETRWQQQQERNAMWVKKVD